MLRKDYIFKKVDGVEIALTVFWKPQDGATTPHRVALAFHGGGFVIGSRYFIPEAEIEYLADANFVIISADYRLCPQIAIFDAIQDAIDAFKWCKDVLLAKLLADASIKADTRRMVAFGQSAGGLLALHLGGLPQPPMAILDFYGVKYTSDKFWHEPLLVLAKIPQFEQDFIDAIYDEPTLTTTMTSLERASASQDKRKKKGMPAPDFSLSRKAWLFTALKNRTHIKAIVKDENMARVDPVRLFRREFPPTFFIHGDADDMVLPGFSQRACSELQKLGVKTAIALALDQSHGFDAGISQDDEEWPVVRDGLDFLIRHASS